MSGSRFGSHGTLGAPTAWARGRARVLAGAVASAVLVTASFPPLDLAPLAWIALVPLFVVLRDARPGLGALAGSTFAVALCALLASWLPGLVDGFFAVGLGGSLALASGVALYFALPFALLGAGLAAAGNRAGPIAVGAAWWCCEALRFAGPLELPWALLAYSQSAVLPFVQAADTVGALGLGAVLAAANAVLAEVVRGLRRPAFPRVESAVVLASLIAAWLYGTDALRHHFEQGDALDVVVVQGGLSRTQRLAPDAHADNLGHYLALSERAGPNADLVVWPELALRFDPSQRPDLWQEFSEHTRRSTADWLVGAPGSRTRALLREPVNTALLVRAGRIRGRHEKVRLVPFSETQPRWSPIERSRFAAGLSLHPLEGEAARVGVLLCSEALFPALARELAAKGANLLVNPSNDDWFASPAATAHQVAVGVFRAVENRRPWLRPSTTGSSVVIDAHGRVLARAPYGEPAVLRARVHPTNVNSPRARLANWVPPAASGALLSCVWLFAVGRRRPE
ncbi:MAG: apolipoprotein N-acyltransferase [Myxococcota bacterium]